MKAYAGALNTSFLISALTEDNGKLEMRINHIQFTISNSSLPYLINFTDWLLRQTGS